MKDNMKNFRDESNEILKNICVTDELKRKTLARCSNIRSLQLKPVLIVSAVFAILIFTFKLYNFSHKTDIARSYVKPAQKYVDKSINNDHKGTKDNETLKEISKADKIENSIVQDKSNEKNSPQNVNSNKDTTIQNKNVLPQNTDNYDAESPGTSQKNEKDDDKNHSENLSAVRPGGVASPAESLSMKDAEKYFESKVLLPSYVPEGFELSNISIPCEGVKSISIKYSLNSQYFTIQESKNLLGLKGDKTLYIGAGKAYVNYFKDEQATSVSWIMNNVEYSLYGNIQENSLIDIANSIK
ncbi:DUF4367 domain-containing protein [Clostridium sp. AWRP]|uniref:DUF4367 domain-containing protein n=1 Tax=Clostridium sp. AWRP TaxID=2212991 RepID=UPI001586D25A|nr:DUF4367 domain-containing protein [Clostridium sp. AWRP]